MKSKLLINIHNKQCHNNSSSKSSRFLYYYVVLCKVVVYQKKVDVVRKYEKCITIRYDYYDT